MEFLYENRKKEWRKALENTPDEDEELTPEEIKAIKEAEKDLKEGNIKPLDEVLGELEVWVKITQRAIKDLNKLDKPGKKGWNSFYFL